MKVLMFRTEWIEPILQGRKVQTVRPVRKVPIIIDDVLSLRVWLGLPYCSKQRKLLDTHCTSVHRVSIDDGGVVLLDGSKHGRRMTVEQCERFAVRDGFKQWEEMHDYFRRHNGPLPFVGEAISWE